MPPLSRSNTQPPSPADRRVGRDVAHLFRKYRLDGQGDERRCDLDPILEFDRIHVCESEVEDCGYAACLVRPRDSSDAGIFIAAGPGPGRRRFSLAHELGHFHIPSHQHVGVPLDGLGLAYSCADAELRARARDARRIEWEANDFAAELLMPSRLFSRDIDRREVTFRTVSELASADMYDVSRTAAAWRVVETTRDACSLVVSVDGQIDWIVCSKAWRYPLAERRRPLPAGSAAAAVAEGELPHDGAEPVAPAVWLTSADGSWRAGTGVTLLESTHTVPQLRQVLSLLWVIEGDE